MSSRIKNNVDFFRLLLQTQLPQQKALLQSLTPEQVDLLTEIVWNLLNSVPLPDKEKKGLQRKKYLKDISLLKRSHKYRKRRLNANKKQIIKILNTYMQPLLALAGN